MVIEFGSRIHIWCVVASYGIGLALELLRLFWPRIWLRWAATTGLVVALFAHTLFLAARGALNRSLPIATQFESLVVLSWLICFVCIVWQLKQKRLGLDLFLLPVGLALLIFAMGFTDDHAATSPTTRRMVATAHGLFLLAGTLTVLLAFVYALMYLLKVRQLKHPTLLPSIRLPSLEQLDRVNTSAIYLSWPLLTIGIGLGFMLGKMSWSDPKVITTVVSWFLFSVLVLYRHNPENRGRKIALMTIVSCAVVLVSVLGDPVFGTSHQNANAVSRSAGAAP